MNLLLLLVSLAPSLALRPKLRRPAARRAASSEGGGEAVRRGDNVTSLTFGEMVTIYHDIWNTMLIGHSFVMWQYYLFYLNSKSAILLYIHCQLWFGFLTKLNARCEQQELPDSLPCRGEGWGREAGRAEAAAARLPGQDHVAPARRAGHPQD